MVLHDCGTCYCDRDLPEHVEDELATLRAERDALAAEVERMRPVVEKAKAWRRIHGSQQPSVGQLVIALTAAVDSLIATDGSSDEAQPRLGQ